MGPDMGPDVTPPKRRETVTPHIRAMSGRMSTPMSQDFFCCFIFFWTEIWVPCPNKCPGSVRKPVDPGGVSLPLGIQPPDNAFSDIGRTPAQEDCTDHDRSWTSRLGDQSRSGRLTGTDSPREANSPRSSSPRSVRGLLPGAALNFRECPY
jgi:hypothetical protein